MKRFLAIFSFVCIYLLSYGQGVDDEQFHGVDSLYKAKAKRLVRTRTVLKTNPLAMLMGDIPYVSTEYRLLGEFVTGPKTSIAAGVSYLGMSPWLRAIIENSSNGSGTALNSWDFAFNGFRLQLGARRYLKSKKRKPMEYGFVPAPLGFYISPLFSYSSATFYEKAFPNDYLTIVHWSVTGNFGYQFEIWDEMTFDPFIGVGYKKNTSIDNLGNVGYLIEAPFIYETSLKINLGFNVGFKF